MEMIIDEIKKGEHDGEIIWICRYNRPDFTKVARRSMPPTRVLIKSNTELTRRIYRYGKSHYAPLNKKGETTKKIIIIMGIYEEQLYPFDNEKECIESWNKQLDEHSVKIDRWFKQVKYQHTVDKELLEEKKL